MLVLLKTYAVIILNDMGITCLVMRSSMRQEVTHEDRRIDSDNS